MGSKFHDVMDQKVAPMQNCIFLWMHLAYCTVADSIYNEGNNTKCSFIMSKSCLASNQGKNPYSAQGRVAGSSRGL